MVYPIDTVKRRMMTQGNYSKMIIDPVTGKEIAEKLYRNSWDCLLKIMKQEGLRGLYAGLSVNLVRGFSGSILLVGYDELKVLFKL